MSRLNESEWIASPSLPTDNDIYLVQTKYNQLFIARFNIEDNEWSSQDLAFSPTTVKFWHKLPENPE